jgi:O-methyltransferase involved in polyketide biosynthesis
METITYTPELENVSETLLVPLFFKAKETLENGIITDHAAVKIIERIQYDFQKMATDKDTQAIIAFRTQILDKIVSEYISRVDKPVIINLGAGLDTRHLRFEEKIKWYQLDLDKPMQLRNLFFEEESINITKSILDFSWIDDVDEKESVLIIIEGVLMYLEENQVKAIFEAVGLNFSNTYVVFDTIPKTLVNIRTHKSIDMKRAPFKWGNNNLDEIETWENKLRKIKEYYFLKEQGYKVNMMHIN